MLVAGALALGAAAPATAGAQAPGDEACANVSPSAAPCVLLDKVVERVSAECRRIGLVPDQSCLLPVGAQVRRQDVADYRSSWTHRTLAYQYRLAHHVPFRDAPWVGTHNSFNSTSEFPTLSHSDSNQQLSLTQQLDIDVRSIELDVHWFPSLLAGGTAPVVCHARSASELHAGCTLERLFAPVIGDLAGWLNRADNREEVLLLYLEDHIGDAAGYARVVSELDARLRRPDGGSLIYKPDLSGATSAQPCALLPLDLTRRKVLDSGAQVVIVGKCASGWAGRVFDWDKGPTGHEEEGNPGAYSDYPACDRELTRTSYDTRMIRYYEDSTLVSAAIDPTRSPRADNRITPAKAGRMVRCGVDLFGFDQLLPRDGRLEALAWSWARGEPEGIEPCAAQAGDARWRTQPCALKLPVACRASDGGWTVSAKRFTFGDAKARCRVKKATFDLPRTGYDNSRLRTAAGDIGPVWIRDRSRAPTSVSASASCSPASSGRRIKCALRLRRPGAATVSARALRGGAKVASVRKAVSPRSRKLTLAPRGGRLRPGRYTVRLTFAADGVTKRIKRSVRVR